MNVPSASPAEKEPDSGIINGEPTPPEYDVYKGFEGEHFQAPDRPHKKGHDFFRRIVDASISHEISWEDVERRLEESIRVFSNLGVDEEALAKVADPTHTDWILWDGPSPPEVLSVEALIHGRNKPRAVVFADSPATRMPSFMAEPAHQSGVDHLVGHLTHFHMGGDGQDEYLSTRFQSLGIRERIREGKWGQALYAPLMAAGLVKHKDIRIGNHFINNIETVGRFPIDAFSEEPVPDLEKWVCDHTLVPIPYGHPDNPPEKRSRFIRAIGGMVPGLQPYTRSRFFSFGSNGPWGELPEQLREIFLEQDDTPYDIYPYDAASHMLLVVERKGPPDSDDMRRLSELEMQLRSGRFYTGDAPPPLKPAPLHKTLYRGTVFHS